MTTPAQARCTKIVHHGRMGMMQCTNPAKPDDTLCGTHRAAADRRVAAPRQQEATAEPTYETTHTVTVTLRWEPGTGPVFRTRYETRDAAWQWIRVAQTGDHSPEVSGRGTALKKDGTPAQASIEMRFANFTDLPKAQFMTTVVETSVGWRVTCDDHGLDRVVLTEQHAANLEALHNRVDHADDSDPVSVDLTAAAAEVLDAVDTDSGDGESAVALNVWEALTGLRGPEGLAYARELAAAAPPLTALIPPF